MKNYLVTKNNGFFPSVFDDFFADFFRPSTRWEKAGGVMSTDVKEREGEYELLIEIPGFKKENLNIEVEDGYLTVSAKREESGDDKYLRRERISSCSRKFYIGDIPESEIKAKFDSGVLSVIVPKEKEKIVTKKTVAID